MSETDKTNVSEYPWVPTSILPEPSGNPDVYKEVWDTLSKVDVSEHVETKMNLSYLSWAWAWGTLMEFYPEAEYCFDEEKFYPDGSCQVECSVSIRGCEREMWLPVMDNRNKAIPKPTAREISDARMRCLVKCLAMWGLGHYIYAGEDLPSAPSKPKSKDEGSGKANGSGVKVEPAGAYIAIQEFAKECKDMTALMEFYKKNESELEKLKETNPDEHAKCMSEFTRRKGELQAEG